MKEDIQLNYKAGSMGSNQKWPNSKFSENECLQLGGKPRTAESAPTAASPHECNLTRINTLHRIQAQAE